MSIDAKIALTGTVIATISAVIAMALVHKSKSRHNPIVESEKLSHFVTLRHTQVRHSVESGTAN